jgi:tartrate-resistant acid phosphatase type 5
MLKQLKRKVRGVLNDLKAAKLKKSFDAGQVIPGPPIEGDSLRFLAVGRQGYGTATTARVAASMEKAAAEKPTHGVFYLGDNFFPMGPKTVDDVAWRLTFEYLYDGPHLRGLPFFAVMGNHDHLGGTPATQIDYARQKKGTGRWIMDDFTYTRDFGTANGRPLVRCVFLDTMTLVKNPQAQLDFARNTFNAPGDPIWRLIINHSNGRSLTKQHTSERVLTPWLDQFIAMKVDAFLSADDWFQQVLDYPGEPLHVSTNGGSDKNEPELTASNTATEFVASQPGFALLEVTPTALNVELRNAVGAVAHQVTRAK